MQEHISILNHSLDNFRSSFSTKIAKYMDKAAYDSANRLMDLYGKLCRSLESDTEIEFSYLRDKLATQVTLTVSLPIEEDDMIDEDTDWDQDHPKLVFIRIGNTGVDKDLARTGVSLSDRQFASYVYETVVRTMPVRVCETLHQVPVYAFLNALRIDLDIVGSYEYYLQNLRFGQFSAVIMSEHHDTIVEINLTTRKELASFQMTAAANLAETLIKRLSMKGT